MLVIWACPEFFVTSGLPSSEGFCCVTCLYTLQAVAAKVEQLEVFGQQELFGPEMFDAVPGQIHLHDVGRQVSWDVIQICKDRKSHISSSLLKGAFAWKINTTNKD